MKRGSTVGLVLVIALGVSLGPGAVPALASPAAHVGESLGDRPRTPLGATVSPAPGKAVSSEISQVSTAASGAVTITTHYGGPNGNPFNDFYPAYTKLSPACGGWCGLASAWGNFDPIGVITTDAAVFGFAVAQADQWLGVRYTTKAPAGVSSSISISALVLTIHESSGISAAGASCAPTSIYEQDLSGLHQNELASCFDSLSITIPDVPGAEDAPTIGQQRFLDFVDAYRHASDLQGLKDTLPSFRTSFFNWSGSVASGNQIGIQVDPEVAAADSGLGTVFSLTKNIVDVTVTETYNGTYSSSGSWLGTPLALQPQPSVSVEGLPDATLLSQQLINFQTNDPSTSCLNGQSINVFTAPKEFPDQFVVHDGLQGSMCAYGTWTIPRTYTGTWAGTAGTQLNRHSNVTVEGYADAAVVGQLTNFQTTDPTYACLKGATINVFTAPAEFPGQYVVHDGMQGSMCAYGTWLIPQTYVGVWLGKGIVISPRSNVTVESYPDAVVVGQVTNFQTTDPRVSCLNGQAINVFSAPNELPGVYVVHDGLQGPMCAYGTWTIPKSYGGTWLGRPASLDLHANVTVESYADAKVVGQLSNFQTTDPTYNCLTGAAINVFKAPAEFPGQLVAHDGLQGPMCAYGTWTIPITYGSTWQGQATNLTAQTYVSVAGYADATLVGQVSNFQTNDPALSCLNGTTVNVYNAPAEYPNQYAVSNGSQSGQCALGTWTLAKTSSGSWKSVTRALNPHTNVAISSFADATVLGQLSGFQTNDLAFNCLKGLTLNVYSAPKEFPGAFIVNNAVQRQCATGTWTFHVPYVGTWQGSSAGLFAQTNVSIGSYADAIKQGQVGNFQTDDAAFTCLNGSALNVYTAPAEFPNQFVVNNSQQSGQCALGTWTIPQTYTGGWSGSVVPVSLTANATVEGYADATVVGQLTNFQSNDPGYSCLNGQAINVFSAPKEFPNQYVVHDGLQGSMCVYGTWTFPRIWYAATWQGQRIPLAVRPNVAVERYKDANLIGVLTRFTTNDSSYACLNGASINVFTAPKEFPGVSAAHNGGQGTQCTYGTWTFAQGWGPAG